MNIENPLELISWLCYIMVDFYKIISDFLTTSFKVPVVNWNITPLEIIFYSIASFLIMWFVKKVVPVA